MHDSKYLHWWAVLTLATSYSDNPKTPSRNPYLYGLTHVTWCGPELTHSVWGAPLHSRIYCLHHWTCTLFQISLDFSVSSKEVIDSKVSIKSAFIKSRTERVSKVERRNAGQSWALGRWAAHLLHFKPTEQPQVKWADLTHSMWGGRMET